VPFKTCALQSWAGGGWQIVHILGTYLVTNTLWRHLWWSEQSKGDAEKAHVRRGRRENCQQTDAKADIGAARIGSRCKAGEGRS
jgi:hypothetical protein